MYDGGLGCYLRNCKLFNKKTQDAVNVAIVCCYGFADPNIRSKPEFYGLNQYLYGILANLALKKPELLIISGGITDEKHGNLSESASTAKALQTLRIDKDTIAENEICEESSKNSAENLYYSIQFAWQFLTDNGNTQAKDTDLNLVVYCDKVRSFKMWVFAKCMFYGLPISIKLVGLDRVDIHPNGIPTRQFLATIKGLKEVFLFNKLLRNIN